MNSTNRTLNRLGVFAFGLVLLVVGAAAAAAAAVPNWLNTWESVAADVEKIIMGTIKETTIAGLDRSWILILVPIVCAILIVLLLLFIFRQGHGRTRTLISDRGDAAGTVTPTAGSVIIDGAVAEKAIQRALDHHPGLMSATVGTYVVRRTSALKITANVRRGVSPHEIRSFIDGTVTAWDTVLGRELPVVIQINAGLITRVAKSTRVTQQPVEA